MIYPVGGHRIADAAKRSQSAADALRDACCDPAKGELLVPYELRLLEEREEFDFEVHILECDGCFERLKRLDEIVETLEDLVARQAG